MIRGLSASASRQIAAFERSHGLPAGEVAHALARWNTGARRPPADSDHFCERDDTDLRNYDFHVRTLLEITVHALTRTARRELTAAIRPADERRLDRTVHNPLTPPELPWWLRRIHT
ncbi:hypothetical protein ACFWPV_15470 [Streptomyces uncialis]|uniref:hypothetical protein n=1 Tax=Streptomyces uncialis TaxID=1048205 RepID=UPI00366264E3